MDRKVPLIDCPVCHTSHVTSARQNDKGVLAATCQNCGYLFKFRSVAPYKSTVSFTVNGKSVTVGNEFSPSATLNDYLRQTHISMGTKVYCKQGGCGVCIVVAKMVLNPNDAPVVANINSCLCPLYACDGWEITTVEGVGSTKTQMHPIQSTLSSYGGTQCGYCSPGHVMNMYGLMQQFPKLNKQFVEDNFEGNICRCTGKFEGTTLFNCRCTGFRPILDAMKSLVPASDTDIEDLTVKLCKTTGRACASDGTSCGGHCSDNHGPRALHLVFGSTQWMKPTTMQDLQHVLAQTRGQKVRIMGANTGTGKFKEENLDNFDVAIDITGIPDLHVNTHDVATKTFTIGGCLALTSLMEIFIAEAAKPGDNGNFNELKKYLYRVASSPIRNRGTWSGNLMLKNKHPSFPSDVFNIMTVLGATLYIGQGAHDAVSVDTFFKTDMTGKVLMKATFKEFDASDVVACYKVMPRSQNSLALVNAAFRCGVSKSNGFLVTTQPIISIGGISPTFHRATKTEAYLLGKQLSSPSTISGAMAVLAQEIVPANDVKLPGVNYRKYVACGLLYKFILKVIGANAQYNYRTAPDVLHDIRPLSSGVQSYDTNRQEWPLNQPLKKLEADVQCTGEAVYADDLPAQPGQLYGAFVTSTVANATIQTINTVEAMKVPGVVRCLTASDLPAGGKNDVTPPLSLSNVVEEEEVMCSGNVRYYGQSIAFIVAESQDVADKAAKLVQVTYNTVQPPILNIDDAIAAKTFVKKPVPEINVGDADHAISGAPHVVTGTFHTPEQIHFHMETQATNVIPTEDGLDMVSTTQWTDGVQQAVSVVTGIPKNRINLSVKRLGGGYGAKISRNNIVAAACGLAAMLTNRPVRARLDIQTNFEMLGRRWTQRADYRVGIDNNGKLLGIDVTVYQGLGYLPNEDSCGSYITFIDSGYYCPNWKINMEALRTNFAMATAVRAPGSTPAIMVIESIMEKVARTLGKDPSDVKKLNFYHTGQVTPIGVKLEHCNIDVVMSQLMTSAQVDTRQELFKFYNQDNRWKKKALAVVPVRFGLSWAYDIFTVLVAIYGKDGTVAVTHGGIELGQGINTKVAQVVAYELGIPVTMVSVKPTNTTVNANNITTGGSTTSESCCRGAIGAIKAINARLAPMRAKMPPNYTWTDLIEKCYLANIVLNETFTETGLHIDQGGKINQYNSYGATCSEVELDVLTGEYQINRVDIVYDCGESLNPAVDIGQVEGSFIMGVGLNTSESVKYDPATGQMLNYDTWDYHPPTNKDIPVDFRVSLLKNAPNPLGVLRSKASGEPPQTMACSVFFALRKCVVEARKDAGLTGEFTFEPPATVETVQQACGVDISQFHI